MKQLGFNEPCFTYYSSRGSLVTGFIESAGGFNVEDLNKGILAPLFQQAFKWFRDEHKLHSRVNHQNGFYWCEIESYNYPRVTTWNSSQDSREEYNIYEEAELACLEKLLDIVEAKLKEDE